MVLEVPLPATYSRLDERSGPVLGGLTWLGPRVPYEGPYRGDTFPLTWGDDDVIYASAGDPVSHKGDGIDVEALLGDPEHLRIEVLNLMPNFTGSGGHGAKSTGMLCLKGVLYMMVHNLGHRTGENAEKCHGYDAQVFLSRDKGKTWEPDLASVERSPMFPGRDFGSPAFINYGKDHDGATDGYVYAVSGQGWANGDQLKVARVDADQIMDGAAWEFVGDVKPDGQPIWVTDQRAAAPVLTDPGFCGYPDVVYVPSIKRYVFLGWHFKVERPDKYSPDDGSELAVYEAPNPWGPFSLVAKLDWETAAVTPYNPRLPLKWFDAEKLEGWLLFSGSWRNGGTSEFYRANVRKFRFERREAPWQSRS